MGASNSPKTSKEEEEEFRVITGELYKSSDKELYIIKQLSEVRHKKLKGLYFLNQCTSNESQKSFFESESLPEACIIYFYTSSSGKPILKTYDEIEIFQPFKEKNFNKIVILSTYSSINDNISNLEVSNYIEKKGGLEFGMVLDFTKNEENLSQMENNFIKNNMIVSISSVGFKEQELNPDNNGEIYNITGNINNESIDMAIKFLFNGKMPKEGSDNSKIINNGIKHIKIKNANINDINDFNKLINILNCFPIQLFTFSENTFINEVKWWELISPILKNNFSIRYIDFHSQNVNDDIISHIINYIYDKNIKIFELSENNLTSKGCEKVSEYLKHVPGSQKLCFKNNSKLLFKSDGVQFITDGLRNNEYIEFLDFSNMDITGCGVYIGEIIKNKSNFKYLYLKNCKLNCKDFKNIFEEIETSESIMEVDISDNNMGGDNALKYIAKAIENNKSLTFLGMGNININMDNYEIIFDAIKLNINISKYILSYNSGLKPKLVLTFFSELSYVKYLEYIPFDPLDKGKDLTLEEKKLIEQIKIDRKDLELVYKENK